MRIPSLFPYYILFLLMRSGAQLRIRGAAGGANVGISGAVYRVRWIDWLGAKLFIYVLSNKLLFLFSFNIEDFIRQILY